MKLLSITILAVFAIFVSAENFNELDEVDQNTVVPIHEIPEFWDNKSPALKSKFVNIGKRIVGGQIAAPNQFPYQAALILNIAGQDGICGGSIISNVSLSILLSSTGVLL